MGRPRLSSHRVVGAVPFALVLAVYGCEREPTTPQPLSGVSITVTPAELSLTVGASAALEATVSDLAGRTLLNRVVTWSSSAPDVVAVSPTGVVTALDVGSASIGAYSDQGVGFARVVVATNFGLPLRRAIVLTEIGTPAGGCSNNEGGLRENGGRDCSHSGFSRYSLDLADPAQWASAPSQGPTPEVLIAADGIIASVCLQPSPITCGPDGPYVVVEHRGGFLSIYGHLEAESVTLRRKTAVARGQPLGRMGMSRGDAAPWVHFELRYNNQGANAASVLERVNLGGRRLADYKAGEIY